MAFTKLNIAVVAPMPSASVSTATAVKPGFFSSWRKANLRSFITQRLHRIDFRGAAGRQPTRQQRYTQQQSANTRERHRVGGLNLVEEIGHDPRQRKRGSGADRNAYQRESRPLPKDQTDHI